MKAIPYFLFLWLVVACKSSSPSDKAEVAQENTIPTFCKEMPVMNLPINFPDSMLAVKSAVISPDFLKNYLQKVPVFNEKIGNLSYEFETCIQKTEGKALDEFTRSVDIKTLGVIMQKEKFVAIAYYAQHKGAEMCGAYDLDGYVLVTYTLEGKPIQSVVLAEESGGADAPYYFSRSTTSSVNSQGVISLNWKNIQGDGAEGTEEIVTKAISLQINEDGTFKEISSQEQKQTKKV